MKIGLIDVDAARRTVKMDARKENIVGGLI